MALHTSGDVGSLFLPKPAMYRLPDQPSFDPATPLYGGDMTFSTGREATGAMWK